MAAIEAAAKVPSDDSGNTVARASVTQKTVLFALQCVGNILVRTNVVSGFGRFTKCRSR